MDNKVPEYIHEFMTWSKYVGFGYIFNRFVKELRIHPQLANMIILNKQNIPAEQKPDPVVIKGFLKRLESDFNNNVLEAVPGFCFSCGKQIDGVKVSSRSAFGFFLCENCNGKGFD